MRIGWYSNAPHIPSGYGQQTAQVALRLKADGHEVAIVSNYGAAASLNWQDIPVFADGLKQYSLDIFPAQLKAWGPSTLCGLSPNLSRFAHIRLLPRFYSLSAPSTPFHTSAHL